MNKSKKALKNQLKKQEKAKIRTNLLNDLTFKKLFASPETKHITLHFLRDVAGIDAREITLEPTQRYNVKKLANAEKERDIDRTQVDLLVKLDNGQLVTVEMQNKNHKHFKKRALFYVTKGYSASYNEDELDDNKFGSLCSVYGVNIVNFDLHKGTETPVVKYNFLREDTHEAYTDGHTEQALLRALFFELIKKSDDPLIEQWRKLFLTGKVGPDAPDYLQEAAKFIAFENLDEEERQVYINFDERAAIRHAERLYDLEEGMEIGENKGRCKERLAIAMKLLQLNLPLDQITTATGLTLEELQKLTKKQK